MFDNTKNMSLSVLVSVYWILEIHASVVVFSLFLFDNLKIISVSVLISIRCIREYRKSMPLKGFIRQDRIQPGCHASKAITTLLESAKKFNLN